MVTTKRTPKSPSFPFQASGQPQSHGRCHADPLRRSSEAGINVEMISTSEMQGNAVVAAGSGDAGLGALNAAFADVVG